MWFFFNARELSISYDCTTMFVCKLLISLAVVDVIYMLCMLIISLGTLYGFHWFFSSFFSQNRNMPILNIHFAKFWSYYRKLLCLFIFCEIYQFRNDIAKITKENFKLFILCDLREDTRTKYAKNIIMRSYFRWCATDLQLPPHHPHSLPHPSSQKYHIECIKYVQCWQIVLLF